MTLRDNTNNILNKTELLALAVAQPAPETKYKLTAPIFETYSLYGEGTHQMGRRLKWRANQIVTQSEIDALYSAASVSTVSPATGLAAGNTQVTITGTNLSGVEGVTFGGTAATNVKVVNDNTVTCKTPAHAAGAVNVVVADDSGNVTKTNGYTYT